MEHFYIKGGTALSGTVKLAGSKNLASKLMIASLFADDVCHIENVPDIGENRLAQELLELTGASVERSGTSIAISPTSARNTDLRTAPTNRLPVLVIAPMLFRCGQVKVPEPGGDRIGRRPINFHTQILQDLGATVSYKDTYYIVEADKLVGREIELPFPSVGATETALLASIWVEGESVIRNIAIEPEVLALVDFLLSLGAQIKRTERTLTIKGTQHFGSASVRTIPDRIEAVSYASLALASGGEITLQDVDQCQLDTFLTVVDAIGASRKYNNGDLRIWSDSPLQATNITTGVHPGFMTDWQQPTAIMLLTANGTSTIHETVHERRFGYVAQLNKMGADIQVHDSSDSVGVPPFKLHDTTQIATITGPRQLQETELSMPDLRAGMAYVSAALIANGESNVYGIEQIDRGYETVDHKLQALGAKIERRGD